MPLSLLCVLVLLLSRFVSCPPPLVFTTHLACSIWKLPSFCACHRPSLSEGGAPTYQYTPPPRDMLSPLWQRQRRNVPASVLVSLCGNTEGDDDASDKNANSNSSSDASCSSTSISSSSEHSATCSSTLQTPTTAAATTKRYYPRHFQSKTVHSKNLLVRFAADDTIVYHDSCHANADECMQQWYTATDLEHFRHATLAAARSLKQASSSRRRRRHQYGSPAVRQWLHALQHAYRQSGGASSASDVECFDDSNHDEEEESTSSSDNDDDNHANAHDVSKSNNIDDDDDDDDDDVVACLGLELWSSSALKRDRRRRKAELQNSIAYWQSNDDLNVASRARHVRKTSLALSQQGRLFAMQMGQWLATTTQQQSSVPLSDKH